MARRQIKRITGTELDGRNVDKETQNEAQAEE